jgi:hypothetical protein
MTRFPTNLSGVNKRQNNSARIVGFVEGVSYTSAWYNICNMGVSTDLMLWGE